MRHLWLHGFASGPGSTKALFVREQLRARGHDLVIPNLNLPSFRDLTVSRMLGVVSQLASEVPSGQLVLFGSSLGGLTAALWAAANPERVLALVLLAPAFDLADRFAARMGQERVAEWREKGALPFDHYATRRPEELSVGFLDDLRMHPAFPLPRAPTLVLQGERDETVDPALAHEFKRRSTAAGNLVRLVLLPDGHELSADLPRLWSELERFLPER